MNVVDRLAGLELEAGELLESKKGDGVDFTDYAADPLGFLRDVLRETDPGPWRAQEEIARAVRDEPLVIVRSSNSMGKDWLAARLALWWVYARRGLVLVTGPTERQVREIVMTEVRRAFHRSKGLAGDLFQMALRVDDDEQRGILAFTSSAASNLTGFHAPRVLVVVTEAQGVEDYAWEAMLACATGSEDRFLAVGNPLAPSGRFFINSRAESWHSIGVSALEHPNVATGETIIPGAVTQAFVDRIAEEYGKGSGTYQSRVLGEFPDQGQESLFSRSWLESAAGRHERGEFTVQAAESSPIVAVDPARYGPDSTAVAVRRGPVIQRLVTWRGQSLTDTAERVVEVLEEEGFTRRPPADAHLLPPAMREKLPPASGQVVVDAVGIGAGVVDQLRDQRFRVSAFNGGQFMGSKDRERFLNERARSYWHLRTLLEDGRIALPRNEALFEELLAVNWQPTTSGQIQIERKTAVKGRLGRSPDLADAVAMAFSGDAVPKTHIGYVPSPWG